MLPFEKRDWSISDRSRFHTLQGSVRHRATCAGAAGSCTASEEGKLELTETLRSSTAVEGIPEGFHFRAPRKGCRERRLSEADRKGVGSLFSRSSRSSAGPQRGFHPEPSRHSPHPAFCAEGPSPLYAHPERLQLRRGLGAIHAGHPVPWLLHGPGTEPGRQLGFSLIPSPQA